MRAYRRLLPALLAAALAGCDMNEYYVTQSAGGAGTSGEAFSFTDPTGDFVAASGNGAPDLVRVSGSVRADSVVVTLTFAGDIERWSADAPNSLDGFVDFDVDEDQGTGIPAAVDEYGGSTGMGADYYFSLRDNGSGAVGLVDAATQEADAVPARWSARAITVTIPRSLLEEEDGTFRLSAVVGHPNAAATDFAPNNGNFRVAPR